ncbi:MAG: hypothetical protein QOI00_776 [Chloroflexota bacterium]|nr:hypothetical protein [Chloroflexota bacterium]
MDFALLIVTAVAAGVGILGLYVALVRTAGPHRRLEEALGVGALRARLAAGEISPEEFAQARRALGR